MNATAARRETTRNGRRVETAEKRVEEEQSMAAEPAAGGGRDGHGRFTKGNAGGPGNPFARQTAQLRSALIQRVTVEDINVIADELILRARCGQLEAIKLLFQYVIGKPTAAVNPDTLDVEEFQQVYAPRKEIMEAAPEITQGLPPHVLSTLVQVTNDACGQQMGKILSSGPEGIEKAQKNLGALFGEARGSGPAKPQTQGDADAAEAALIRRILDGDEDEVQESDEPPSAKASNGGIAGDGRRPSANGNERPDGRPAPARGGGLGFPRDSGEREGGEDRLRPPSTKGHASGKPRT